MSTFEKPKNYHCGTLTYTKAGLLAVFGWLLWGDFCFTLMEAVVPSILPLKLKALGCSNWMMGVIMTTIPGILNITVCPYVSFKSDRYRSRWGRRLPFIIGTLPFLSLALGFLGYSDEISVTIQTHVLFLRHVAPATLTIALVGLFLTLFQFFNMFVNSVFWYMFNDVVPPQFLARFLGIFRIVGTGAAALYNYFVFQYAESHMREIFLGAAVLYFIGFGLMCLKVKEGEYPPVEGETDKDKKGLGSVRTFLQESFSHKFYVLQFAANAFVTVAAVIGIYGIFFNREMGLSLADIGKLGAISGVASMLAVYFAAIFVDRWHPLRVVAYLRVFAPIGMLTSWVWLFITLPGSFFFWLSLGGGLIAAFQTALAGAADFPMIMRIFPKSRFGQFCSANAVIQAIFRMIGGIVAGLFIDGMKRVCGGSDFAYRYIFVWMTVFAVIGVGLTLWQYLYWYKLGGEQHYHPPAPWSPEQREEMEIVPSIPPQSRWLRWSLRMFHAIMAVSVLGLPFLMWWMRHQGTMVAFRGFAVAIVPLSLIAWGCWFRLEKSICRDMVHSVEGEPLCNGIPHHGVLMVISSKYLLALFFWVIQIVVAIHLNMQQGAVVFGIANVVTNFLLIGGVWLLCRIERGHSVIVGISTGRTGVSHE